MKKKFAFYFLPLLLMFSLLTSCEEDYHVMLISHFEEMLIDESVERIVIVQNQRYIEVHIDLEKALSGDFSSELDQAEVYRIMNQTQEFFIAYYQDLLDEYKIVNAPGLEFEERNNIGETLATYGWLAFLILGGMGSVVIIVRQRSKLKNLQDRVDQLEEELRYKK